MMSKKHMYLLSMGELCLKGKNRNVFVRLLKENFKRLVVGRGHCDWKHEFGRVFVVSAISPDIMFDRLQYLFGLSGYAEVTFCEPTWQALTETVDEYVKELFNPPTDVRTFKISARRSNKKFEYNSLEINRKIGGLMCEKYPALKVDLHQPEIEIVIEIRDKGIYVYSQFIKGALGLPVGSGGSGVLLLSGGIDSPVAGWKMLKRGMRVFPVHFHSPPFTSEQSLGKVRQLAASLEIWGGESQLAVFDLKEIQTYLKQNTRQEWLTIMSRKCMMSLANRYAKTHGILSLVTGENLGQVASQTVEGMNATGHGIPVSIFRPLIGYEKVEIVDIARRIRTFDTSIIPFEDCCTLFSPKHPETKPRLEVIEKEFSRLNLEPLLDACFVQMRIEKVRGKENIPDVFK